MATKRYMAIALLLLVGVPAALYALVALAGDGKPVARFLGLKPYGFSADGR